MKYSPWVVVLLLLPGMAVAQSESAYPQVPEPVSVSSVLTDPTVPPPADVAPVRRDHWWTHIIPTDREIWLLSNMADIGQYAYQEVDTLETAHIKSGKGPREIRLAVKMLVGTGAAGALVGQLRRGHHRKKPH